MSADSALTTEDVDDVTLLRLVGELDVASVAQLRDRLQLARAPAAGTWSSCSPWRASSTRRSSGVLLGALRRAKEERRGFVFALEPDAASGAIDRLLEMSGLMRIFPVYASVEEATAAAAGGRTSRPSSSAGAGRGRQRPRARRLPPQTARRPRAAPSAAGDAAPTTSDGPPRVRRAAAQRTAAALRPAPRGRGRASRVGPCRRACRRRAEVRRLAVHTEDHPLEYADLRGPDPGGRVRRRDDGHLRPWHVRAGRGQARRRPDGAPRRRAPAGRVDAGARRRLDRRPAQLAPAQQRQAPGSPLPAPRAARPCWRPSGRSGRRAATPGCTR